MLGSRAPGFTLMVLIAACGGRTTQSNADDPPTLEPAAPRAGTSSQGGMDVASAGARSMGSAGASTAGAGAVGSGGASTCGDDAPPAMPLPQNLTGEYELVTCGTWTPCDADNSQITAPLPGMTLLSVTQDPAEPRRGTVMLNGTGEALLDNRIFEAEFKGKSFLVSLDGPLSPSCAQRYTISLHYDFEGVGSRSLTLDFERSPKCTGNDGHYCVGRVQGAFGNAHPIGEQR